MSLAALCLLGIVTYLTFENFSLKQQIDTANKEKENLKANVQEIKTAMQKELVLIEQVSAKNQEKQVSGHYQTWMEAGTYAEDFYNDSNRRFKKDWGRFLAKQAMEQEIDPYIVYELLKVETGNTFDPNLVGPETKYGHAYGMGQFMKNTAPWIAKMAGVEYKEEKLFDPYYSILLSVTYLDYLHQKYKNWDKALTAYHRGMGGLQEFIKDNGHANSWYSEEITTRAKEHKNNEVALAGN
ncbi:lytic transglycosylase domain-containing protein [Pseudalkalibacillus caeni]|uniref:Lytic transglycosylase domain-containing protein n=1 Tax=Exobacillus caeni TaxID=2574798 RepID=A0A5R9F6P8_9BACL|nr:transglycosylase SLT domain-containing protein [Pseudalkalibacillus caeni]TLS39432.1 lytic transglycosylase domain-containing protein [Pseudalkalibacillus caeni]